MKQSIDIVRVHQSHGDIERFSVAVERQRHAVAHLQTVLNGVDVVSRRNGLAVDRDENVAGLHALLFRVGALRHAFDIQPVGQIVIIQRGGRNRGDGDADGRPAGQKRGLRR